MNLADFMAKAHSRFETSFQHYLIANSSPAATLQKAICYSSLNGGKRIRPLFVYLTGYTFQATWESMDAPASAIEFIHIYSLIHDDLPSMDNSDLRRGKPACHKAFDEASAILAGDALQPLAFEILTQPNSSLTLKQQLDMVNILSKACGMKGMVAGQMLDIEKVTSLDTLKTMYQLKTGALLHAAIQLGAISAAITDPKIFNALHIFAENIGLAFQIQDDIFDIEGVSQETGKPQGLDQINQKITWPSLIGIEKSRQEVEILFNNAIHSLDFLGEKKKLLCEFAALLMQRNK